MAENVQRKRLAEWADNEGVDEATKLIFLSLPFNVREAVRSAGSVGKARNRSAVLMKRMRTAYPAYVELDSEAQQDWTYIREIAKPMVWILVRGESNRDGWRKDRST